MTVFENQPTPSKNYICKITCPTPPQSTGPNIATSVWQQVFESDQVTLDTPVQLYNGDTIAFQFIFSPPLAIRATIQAAALIVGYQGTIPNKPTTPFSSQTPGTPSSNPLSLVVCQSTSTSQALVVTYAPKEADTWGISIAFSINFNEPNILGAQFYYLPDPEAIVKPRLDELVTSA